jgi:hypothetical protein
MNYNYFIPNIIGCQACWFIGRIHMRLTAGDAPVTNDSVNILKIVPV